MIRLTLTLSVLLLTSYFATPLRAQHQYSQHRIALEVIPGDSLAVQNVTNQLLYWEQNNPCTYQAQPLRSITLRHLRDGRFRGHAQPQDSTALSLDSVQKRLKVNRYIKVYDVQTLAPKDSALRVSAQTEDIQGFETYLYWFFDSTAQSACTQLIAFAPIIPQQALTWVKLSDSAKSLESGSRNTWKRQMRMDIDLADLPEQGKGLRAIVRELLQALRQKELKAYKDACDTTAADQIDLWLQGGPLLYTLKNPDTQEEFTDTVQILPLKAHRILRLACLLVWQYDEAAQQLRVSLRALGPIKRKPMMPKSEEQPLFWWHF